MVSGKKKECSICICASKVLEPFISVPLTALHPNFNIEELVSLLNNTCKSVLDLVAPLIQGFRIYQHPSPSHFTDASQDTCEKLLISFTDKVKDIRQRNHPHILLTSWKFIVILAVLSQCPCPSYLKSYPTWNQPCVALILLPPNFSKTFLTQLGLVFCPLLIVPWQKVYFPLFFKQPVVKPLLKKPNLEPSDLNNSSPISKLHFHQKF